MNPNSVLMLTPEKINTSTLQELVEYGSKIHIR